MTDRLTPGIVAGRRDARELVEAFADLHPPLTAHEARVAADRCYFCHDAPCVTACPTSIDIPQFIREISTGATRAAAKTIFDQNILGGMCARVCPTETLCEEACVREAAEGEPVQIGRLQRFATDAQMATGAQLNSRSALTGKRVAVVGAGPAGLACAHRLAVHGHDVTLYDAKNKAGGLNEFGIAAYKTVGGFAQAEIDWLLSIGGITLETGKRLGDGLSLEQLQAEFDAVFLGIGLGGVNALRAEGEELGGVLPAVEFIADLRQADDLSTLPVGRNVVVIGGGMTAVDAAVQSKLLGAETVTIAYRRGREAMSASEWEQDLATAKGVTIRHWAQPVRITGNGAAAEVEFEYTRSGANGLEGTGEIFRLPADQVFTAIGQTLNDTPEGLALEGGKIKIDGEGRTSVSSIWAGGDCATGGDDLTVTAVAEGRDAAESIHRTFG
ncbi:MAG: NAD(P)-dependent oxidoreductase [Paracoccaceae bacterium]|nr:NAD(P)-dependent oxidoreductase [Paracoccaceae bacterium]